MLCEDFMRAINDHRTQNVYPSEMLCIDESFSRWYGVGGSHLGVGLPCYRDLDRKPESGREIQNIADGVTGIMLRMQLVKSEDERDDTVNPFLNHGTNIALSLSAPWSRTGRHVCADSFFASFECATALYDAGLRFTGVVKTASRCFTLRYLSLLQMSGRGDSKTVTTTVKSANGEIYSVMGTAWVDRKRHHFVNTAGTSRNGSSGGGKTTR